MNDSLASLLNTPLTQSLGIKYPIIGGPMYPCSNPELVAAVSEAGGIGVVQPISLTYVFGYDFREGLRYIRSLTDKPIGMNALIEQSSKRYRQRMEEWIDIALEEGVSLIVTSLGKPDWVVQKAHAAGALVYHDATEAKWGQKGIDCGVDGLIAVNDRAGGHAGAKNTQTLYDELASFDKPVICAGGIGNETDFMQALETGYAGVQMGTRFIATTECRASELYKQAILDANESDIVLSERITGVPVSIINTPYVHAQGIKLGPLGQRLLNGKSTKHLMRTLLAIRSIWTLKKTALDETGNKDYWQAGKSVGGIKEVESVAEIVERFVSPLR